MKLFDRLMGRYAQHDEAVIISCFFNPMNSPYRLAAFHRFHDSITHMPHQIVECVIGSAEPQLPDSKVTSRVNAESLLWHKEALLNGIIRTLPPQFKYVFWVDADVLFTNRRWLLEGVEAMQRGAEIIQPFEYCIHLEQDEDAPSIDLNFHRPRFAESWPVRTEKRLWRSFCANCVSRPDLAGSDNYDRHGHVGFAWGAQRALLEAVPLYDRALIGGADHIIAHAAAGQIPCPCISKSFTEDIDAVNHWSKRFHHHAKGRIGYCAGDLYHLWHGDIEKRDYLKRIQEFTPQTKRITRRDNNGLHVSDRGDDDYVRGYFASREVCSHDDGFMQSMLLGYMTDSTLIGGLVGGNLAGAMVGDMLNRSDEKSCEDELSRQQPYEQQAAPHHAQEPTNSVPSFPAVELPTGSSTNAPVILELPIFDRANDQGSTGGANCENFS